jgi:hypothetical protein
MSSTASIPSDYAPGNNNADQTQKYELTHGAMLGAMIMLLNDERPGACANGDAVTATISVENGKLSAALIVTRRSPRMVPAP